MQTSGEDRPSHQNSLRLAGRGHSFTSMEPRSDKPKVVTLFEPERMARIKEEEKRRAMPEKLMLWALITVGVLTIAPVGLLALVGY